MTGWWATAARSLALVLALALATPTVCIAEDFAFHQGHQGHDLTELSLVSNAASGTDQAGDPGLTCHVHCGCHIAVGVTVSEQASPQDATRPSYARVSETVSSISPDRLPRPPRA
ncbi:hypothetical protein [Methylobacterium haplocladii]|nr:hypothetical protein [Methylobacterium haplocladii]